MDSHVFHLAAAELSRLLHGARVEKIHGPVPGVHVFTVFALGARRQLVLRFERQSPLLFFSGRRLSNPARPPARVMRLRKYCANRRLGAGIVDFLSRRIAFPVGVFPAPDGERPKPAPGASGSGSVRRENAAVWLLLDLRDGADVLFSLPPGFGAAPVWPGAAVTDALCDRPWSKKEADGPWRDHAVLTPFLRETLAGLDAMEGRALLVDLEAGGGGIFPYADASGRLTLCSAWPLPEAVLRRRGLALWREESAGGASGLGEFSAAAAEKTGPGQARAASALMEQSGADASFQREFPVLSLVSRAQEALFFAELGPQLEREERRPCRREAKRATKLLAKLDREEARLKGLAELRGDARLLRTVLWQYPAEARLESVSVPVEAEGGMARTIALNPLLTLRENMARMFHVSARGARGLDHVKQRRAEVLGAMPEATEAANGERAYSQGEGEKKLFPKVTAVLSDGASKASGDPEPPGAGRGAEGGRPAGPRLVPWPVPEAGRRVPQRRGEATSLKDVARFLSSDGFTLLRGKNALGNQALLKLGQPHDLWLHALDGPSAHLIIRRSHAGEGIPDTTLLEAAALVGEKSWQRHDAKAHIMVALLRHVHAVKGAAPGTVRVDAVLRTVTAVLDGSGGTSQQ